jgi:murein DD-endopeptidase MepM/ murein hydrolase activator NlpD
MPQRWRILTAPLMFLVLAQGPGQTTVLAEAMALDARALQPGELVVVTLSFDQSQTSVHVSAFDRSATAYPIGGGTWQALFGIDLEQPAGTYAVIAEARTPSVTLRQSRELVVLPKRFPTRRLRVPPQFVDPPASLRNRIEQEAEFLRQVYARPAPERLWRAPFVRPVPDAANSRFGTRSVFNGEARSPHSGTDFASGPGTPVKSPNAGRVVAARELYFSGNTVIIDHGLGLFSLLAHLSTIEVSEGDIIAPGDVVGLVGATGRVTGPHLHWAMRVSGARIDPLGALALMSDRR